MIIRNVWEMSAECTVNELHAPARRNFPRRHVIVHGYDDLWYADVVEMRLYTIQQKLSLHSHRYRCVESKHAWAAENEESK